MIGAVAATVVILLAIAIYALSSPENSSVDDTPSQPIAEEKEAEILPDQPANPAVNPEPFLAGQKLLQQPRDMMQRYLEATGRYPSPATSGTLQPEQRLSWIATLESVLEPDRLEPLWDRPWDDPLNEHFVRRALPHWINPQMNPKTSPNRFPATHFVGIAGAGRDAPELLRSHERAGIFGNQETASLDELGDGASNVWMISGVQQDIGSWAAGGTATIRPWTKGPVIGGPDGFGTGNPDSMPILMADGSVRTLSAATDSSVLTSLASIHSHRPTQIEDQNPIAENLTPEKKDGSAMPLFQIDPLRAPKPPEAELAGLLASLQKELQAEADKPEINVEKQLAQKLLLFDQTAALPVKTLLDQLEELSAVPIVIDPNSLGEAADRLDSRVSISLIEPTVKQLLEKLLYRAKLGYRIEKGKIVITPDPLPFVDDAPETKIEN